MPPLPRRNPFDGIEELFMDIALEVMKTNPRALMMWNYAMWQVHVTNAHDVEP